MGRHHDASDSCPSGSDGLTNPDGLVYSLDLRAPRACVSCASGALYERVADPGSRMKLLPPSVSPIGLLLRSLGTGRAGLSPAFGESLAEAASVCLDERGHSSPTELSLSGAYDATADLGWDAPTGQQKRCWNDDEEATEQGAYGIASLLVEQCGLEVVQRSKKKTGFDFWLGEIGGDRRLFQGLSRLEVSGIRDGSDAAVKSRVKSKMTQTETSDVLGLPAVVVVVEFGAPRARMVERCLR